MESDSFRSRIMVLLVADALGFAIFWLHRAFGAPSRYFDEIMLLTLGISNGIIVLAAIGSLILLIPMAIARTYEAWFG